MQQLGIPNDPYLIRWVLDFGLFSLRLHHWRHSDDLRNPHDHAWDFITFILFGSYEDVSPDGNETMHAGQCTYRTAEHKHSVHVISKNCWTFLITGPERRKWGFWVNNKFRKRNKYFYEHGHHTKEQTGLRNHDNRT